MCFGVILFGSHAIPLHRFHSWIDQAASRNVIRLPGLQAEARSQLSELFRGRCYRITDFPWIKWVCTQLTVWPYLIVQSSCCRFQALQILIPWL
jgi:hypothetical protein